MKTCTKCGEDKPLTEFYIRSETGKPRGCCKSCANSENLNRYRDNASTREAHRRAARKHGLKKYGLTPEAVECLLETQDSACAICRKPVLYSSRNKLEVVCVDHCHATGLVRGLLCFDCNVGLGKFFDRPELLERAASYLRINQSGETP